MSKYSKPTYLPLDALGEDGAIDAPTVATTVHTVPPKKGRIVRHLITLIAINTTAGNLDITVVISRPSGKNLPAFSRTVVTEVGAKGQATASMNSMCIAGEDVELSIQASGAGMIFMGWAELA